MHFPSQSSLPLGQTLIIFLACLIWTGQLVASTPILGSEIEESGIHRRVFRFPTTSKSPAAPAVVSHENAIPNSHPSSTVPHVPQTHPEPPAPHVQVPDHSPSTSRPQTPHDQPPSHSPSNSRPQTPQNNDPAPDKGKQTQTSASQRWDKVRSNLPNIVSDAKKSGELPTKGKVPTVEQAKTHVGTPPDKFSFWSGIPKKDAEESAKQRGTTTLQSATGGYLDRLNDKSPLNKQYGLQKGQKKQVIDNASEAMAKKASELGKPIELQAPPPPHRDFQGSSRWNDIEKPVVTGQTGDPPVPRIDAVHPTVPGAETSTYEMFPKDNQDQWTNQFGSNHPAPGNWKKSGTGALPPKNRGGPSGSGSQQQQPPSSGPAKKRRDLGALKRRQVMVDHVLQRRAALLKRFDIPY